MLTFIIQLIQMSLLISLIPHRSPCCHVDNIPLHRLFPLPDHFSSSLSLPLSLSQISFLGDGLVYFLELLNTTISFVVTGHLEHYFLRQLIVKSPATLSEDDFPSLGLLNYEIV